MLHTLYSGAFPWVFLGYAPLLGEIFQLQPKACYAYDHEPSCNTQLLKDPLLWRVSLTEDSSFCVIRNPGNLPPFSDQRSELLTYLLWPPELLTYPMAGTCQCRTLNS